MPIPAPDLTRTFPRSPSERLGGLAHLPRMIDKARADRAGALGEYSYPCPMDRRALDFLGLDAGQFQETAVTHDDAALLEWLESHAVPRSKPEKDAFSAEILALAPDTPEKLAHFKEALEAAAPGRTDITTWAQLIDADEGRI
ncbi:MAG: DUF5069 domain-containing protein [Leptospirillia bacterium]